MSDTNPPADPVDHPSDSTQFGAEVANPYGAPPVAPYSSGDAVPTYGAPLGLGPRGEVRSTGTCFLLTIVTLGFYTWYWWYKTHDEMKRHSGDGIGGGLALVLAIFLGFVMPFFTSSEVGNLYARRGQPRPVTAVTALWYVLLAMGLPGRPHRVVRQDQRGAQQVLGVLQRPADGPRRNSSSTSVTPSCVTTCAWPEPPTTRIQDST